ncbi:basic proline-rich protein-like [Eschrichtius robustus]|uniref:basic proline-rich protein-like n=1 Tax=Eschrichtius robustus TaxID=9764 RepID=UPI0035C078E5
MLREGAGTSPHPPAPTQRSSAPACPADPGTHPTIATHDGDAEGGARPAAGAGAGGNPGSGPGPEAAQTQRATRPPSPPAARKSMCVVLKHQVCVPGQERWLLADHAEQATAGEDPPPTPPQARCTNAGSSGTEKPVIRTGWCRKPISVGIKAWGGPNTSLCTVYLTKLPKAKGGRLEGRPARRACGHQPLSPTPPTPFTVTSRTPGQEAGGHLNGAQALDHGAQKADPLQLNRAADAAPPRPVLTTVCICRALTVSRASLSCPRGTVSLTPRSRERASLDCFIGKETEAQRGDAVIRDFIPKAAVGGRKPRWGGTGEREAPTAVSWGRPVASFLPVAGSLLERTPRPRTPMVNRPSSRRPPGCFPKPSPMWALRSRPDPTTQCPGPPTPPEAPGGPTPLPWHPGPADTEPSSEVSGLSLRPDGPPGTPGPAGLQQDTGRGSSQDCASETELTPAPPRRPAHWGRGVSTPAGLLTPQPPSFLTSTPPLVPQRPIPPTSNPQPHSPLFPGPPRGPSSLVPRPQVPGLALQPRLCAWERTRMASPPSPPGNPPHCDSQNGASWGPSWTLTPPPPRATPSGPHKRVLASPPHTLQGAARQPLTPWTPEAQENTHTGSLTFHAPSPAPAVSTPTWSPILCICWPCDSFRIPRGQC